VSSLLEKVIPKLPAAAFYYWDRFLGICLVLAGVAGVAGLVQGVTSSAVGLLLSGFGLITFSMARECFRYIGAVRVTEWSAQYKWSRAYPRVLASALWLAVSWVLFRYAALNFHITEQWVRWIFRY
jgi:hypothetical protein